MKFIQLALLLAIVPALGSATEEKAEMRGAFRFQEGMATIVVDGKYGYIDTHGKVVIPPKYEMASGMSGGRAAVVEGGKIHVIDRAGKSQPDNPDLLTQYFAPGSPLSAFYEVDASGKAKWGYKDRKGKVVIKPRFDGATGFNGGLAAFSVKDAAMPGSSERWGYIDMKGNVVIPATFQVSLGFSEGLAKVVQNYQHYFIDQKGQRAFAGDYSFVFDFSEGLAAVNVAPAPDSDSLNLVGPGKWGYIDKKGALILPAVYEQAYPFLDGVAPAMQGGKWGLINKRGEFVVKPLYREIGTRGDGLAAVSMETADRRWKWAIVNMKGELVAPPTFSSVGQFSQGFVMVSIDGKRGYVDYTGKYLWEPTK